MSKKEINDDLGATPYMLASTSSCRTCQPTYTRFTPLRSDKVKEAVGYNAVPPPAADLYLSPKKDLSWTSLPEFVDDTVTDYSRPSPTVASTSAEGQNKDSSTSKDVASPNTPKPFVKFVKPKDSQSESPEFVLKKKACYNCGDFSHLANDCRKRAHGAPMRPPHRSVGHRPHGPSMNPITPNMNGARPNRSYFIQTPSYETRPFLKSLAVKTQYRASWVPTVNRNNPLLIENFPLDLVMLDWGDCFLEMVHDEEVDGEWVLVVLVSGKKEEKRAFGFGEKHCALHSVSKDCRGLPEADHCQPPQYTVNHPIFNAHNDLLNSQNKLMEQVTSMCEMIPACSDDDDDYNFAITPNETVDSLSMGDEHLNTISATESNKFIKSSVENLIPNPKKIFSNPLFEEEIIPMKIDQHYDNTKSDLVESLRTHDSSLIISSKIDSLLDEFAGIDETNCDPEEDIRLIERLLYDNSSPRPPKEFVSENSNAEIESFSPSPIPVEDSDSLIEEIDLPFTPDDPMPPCIEDDDYDSERDILILKDLPSNDTLSLPVIESYHFDIPLFFRPPAKPPDGNTGILNIKTIGDISEQKFLCLDLRSPDCPDCDDSRALSFCPSFTRASHPQLHFGNPFYDFVFNSDSARDVYSKRRIIAVTELKIVEWHNYKHLDWITKHRDLEACGRPSTGDGTLIHVRTALDDGLKGIQVQYLPQSIWRKGDKDKAAAMIQAIDKKLKTRRIMRSLERFVGGKMYEGDFRMLQRTI
nr:hypothetical protein [Tanacetum cinerariifolium]